MSSRAFVVPIVCGVLLCVLASHVVEAQTPAQSAGGARAFVPLAPMHGASIRRFAVDPGNPKILYAGTDLAAGSILRSEDGGVSWEVVSTSGPDDVVRAIAVDPADSSTIVAFRSTLTGTGTGTLYLSTDRGSHWHKFPHQPVGERGAASGGRGIVIDARGATLVIADNRQGIFRSADFGRSWTNPLPASEARTYGLYTDPNDSMTLWTAGLDTLAQVPAAWVSHDFGRSWTESPMPILDPSLEPLPTALAVQPGTGKILAVWNGIDPSTFDFIGGVIASLDGGKSWSDSSTGIVGEAGPLKWNGGNTLLFDPTAPNTVFASGNGDFAQRSLDGGASWDTVGPPPEQFTTFALSPAGSGVTLLGATGNFVLKSRDEGGSWQPMGSGPDTFGVSQLLETDDFAHQLFGLSAGTVLERSDDQGQSWTTLSPPGRTGALRAMATDAINTLYVATRFSNEYPLELWRSIDRGRSWIGPSTVIPSGNQSAILELLTDPNRVGRLYALVGTFNLGLRSDDGGSHWRHFSIGFEGDFPAPLTRPLAVDDLHSGWLYAAMASGLWRSTDAGASWSPLRQLPVGAYGIAGLTISGGVLYVVVGADDGTFSLQRSSDGGLSWSPITSAFGTAPYELTSVSGGRLVAYPTSFEGFLGGTCQPSVAGSTDAGTTWTPVDLTQVTSGFGSGCISVMPTANHLYVSDPSGSGQTFGATWRALSRATPNADTLQRQVMTTLPASRNGHRRLEP